MFVFVVQMNRPKDEAAFARWCQPGLTRTMTEADQLVIVRDTQSVARGYNTALDQVQDVPDLEAVVFLHPDLELQEPDFGRLVRQGLAFPQVGIMGPIGAREVRSLAWWAGQGIGYVRHEEGGVYFGRAHLIRVDALDGQLLIMPGELVRLLRFDLGYEQPGQFVAHAHDVDICFQAKAADRVNLVLELRVQHHTYGGYGDRAIYDQCNTRFQQKWNLTT